MNLAVSLAEYLHLLGLVTFDPVGRVGDCFIEFLPDAPDEAVALFIYGGAESDAKFGWDNPDVQVRVRGTQDPRVSRGRCQAIYDALHGLNNTTLPDGTLLSDCYGIQSSPQTIGRDANNRHEHVINLRTEVRNPARPAA